MIRRAAAAAAAAALLLPLAPAPGAAQAGCAGTALADPAAADRAGPAEARLRWRRAWPLADGSGVTVAVIDTGVADHPRLGGVLPGADLTGGADPLADCEAHGTFVAGRIAARPGPDRFSGVAPGARILSIRQTTGGIGDLGTLAEAVDAAVAAGARVLNVSLTACAEPGRRPAGVAAVAAAVARAERAGAVTVAAAGNAGGDCPAGSVAWPAAIPGVLAVTAIDMPADPAAAAQWALRGDWVDLAAPGGPLLGPDPRGAGLADRRVVGGRADPVLGTSFAAPVVSGAAALLLSRDPGLRPAEVRRRLTGTAAPVPGASGIGAGVVDPVAALSWPEPPAPADPAPVPAPAPQAPADPAPAARVRAAAAALAAVAALAAPLALLAGRAAQPVARAAGPLSSGPSGSPASIAQGSGPGPG